MCVQTDATEVASVQREEKTGLKKIICLPSPDRPKSGGADSEYFIGPLKANIFSELKNIS